MIKKVKLFHGIPTEHKRFVRKQSNDLGLDIINSDHQYTMRKIGSKKYGYDYYEGSIIIKDGICSIVGSDQHVALFIQSSYNGDWFRTSPIVKCSQGKDCVIIETQNSIYELK